MSRSKIENITIAILTIILLSIIIHMFLPGKQTVARPQPTIGNYDVVQILYDNAPEKAEELEMPEYDIKLPLHLQELVWNICQSRDFSYELALSVLYQESKFDQYAVYENRDKVTGIVKSKDLGYSGLNSRYLETHASVAGIASRSFSYFNPYHNISAGVNELINHRDYWREQWITNEETLWYYCVNSFNMGRQGYINYLNAGNLLSRKYDQSVAKWKEQLERYGRLD